MRLFTTYLLGRENYFTKKPKTTQQRLETPKKKMGRINSKLLEKKARGEEKNVGIIIKSAAKPKNRKNQDQKQE